MSSEVSPEARPEIGPETGPEVSIVIAHLNQPDLLRDVLTSLYAQHYDMSRAEVIVVDNGSRALPEAVIADFPGAVLVTEAQPGPGHARNRGVEASRAPIIAFTDADCKVAPYWLSIILARFAADPGLGILGGDIRMTIAEPDQPTPAEAYECVYAYNQRKYIEGQGFSVTANMAVRRAVFDAVGPFAGIDVAEDMDWGWRATAMGHPTRYEPAMVIYHPARRSMKELRAKWDRNISHHWRQRAGDLKGRVKWIAQAIAMPPASFAQIPKLLSTDRLDGLWARWQAFRGLFGVSLYRSRRMFATMAGARGGNLQWNRD